MGDQVTLTDEDVNCLKYFITEKGDVTRWCDWDLKKDLVAKEFPMLISALEKVKRAERHLKFVLDTIYLED